MLEGVLLLPSNSRRVLIVVLQVGNVAQLVAEFDEGPNRRYRSFVSSSHRAVDSLRPTPFRQREKGSAFLAG